MLKVYGSKKCPDCVALEKAFEAENIEYEYHNITDNLKELKVFLSLRDTNPKFLKAKEKGLIGIPIIEKEDGTLTFQWQDFLSNPVNLENCADGVCGIDGK